MTLNEEDIQKKVNNLVEEYRSLESKKGPKLKKISEADVRADFIDRLFEILGWNIHDVDEYNREKYVRGAGFADITLQINNEPMIFVEAKRFGSIPFVDREKTDWIEEERQVLNYAASPGRKIKWAVLTNFEKFRLFNALNGMLVLSFESIFDYKDRLKGLLYLSREMVSTGRIDELTEREERPDIDERFLDNLKSWRLSLAKSIYEKNKENGALLNEDGNLEIENLKNAVQRILDRLITVRYAEDKLILDSPDQLKHIRDSWYATRSYSCLIKNLMNFFEGFDKIHDSKIFEKGHICEQVEIDDEVLGDIIEELYDINFRKFDFDVLGNTYETYLGHTIHIDEKRNVTLKPVQETRKEHGIYYTPPYVVDYIVKNTVGEVLKGKTPDEVKKIRVLDPACGSGSFLIKAYDYFKEYYEGLAKAEDKKVRESMAKNNGQLPDVEINDYGEYEKNILKDNIYGVDLDSQAAEIASVNLMLKALQPKEKLPLILGENIRVGNSLISGTEEELDKYFGEDWKEKRPFNWEEEFNGVFDEDNPGFDVVIGNPPYVSAITTQKKDREYFISSKKFEYLYGRFDIYSVFLERALKLADDGGFIGFIIPFSFYTQNYAKRLRKYILDNFLIVKIVDFSELKVFDDATVYTTILILKKSSEGRDSHLITVVKPINGYNGIQENEDSIKLILQKYFDDTPDNMFRLELNSQTIDLLDKIKENNILIGEFCYINSGLMPFTPTEKITDNRVGKYDIIANQQINKDYKRYLEGKCVHRYNLQWQNKFIRYIPKEMHRPKFPEMFVNPKILFRGISADGQLIATFDESGIFVDQKLVCCLNAYQLENTLRAKVSNEQIILSKNYNEKYLLGLINSSLINFYCRILLVDKLSIVPETIRNIPIFPASLEQQEPIIQLADRMLSLNRQLNEINVDFDHYVNLSPREKDVTLEIYLKDLPPADITVGKDRYGKSASQIVGKVREFEVGEEGENLIFKVGYEKEFSNSGAINFDALTCKIPDKNFRKFLHYALNEYVTPGKVGKGKIYDRLLKIKIPCFDVSPKKNKEIIKKLMETYLPEVEKYNELKSEIEKADKEIDSKVYELYGLTEEEIKIVEESLRKGEV